MAAVNSIVGFSLIWINIMLHGTALVPSCDSVCPGSPDVDDMFFCTNSISIEPGSEPPHGLGSHLLDFLIQHKGASGNSHVKLPGCCEGFRRSPGTTNCLRHCYCPNLRLGSRMLRARSNSNEPVRMDCTGMYYEDGIADRRWTNGVIPYVLDGFNMAQRDRIMQAIHMFNSITCLRILPRTTEANYIRVYNGSGCSSHVGMIGGVQDLSLHDGSRGTCLYPGIVMHEFLHAAGFYHEQNRPDRDDFVCVNLTNVDEWRHNNFEKVTGLDTLGTPYTFSSVMHYGASSFNIDPTRPSIYPVSCDPDEMTLFGQRNGLDPVDIERVQLMYAGLGSCPR